MINILIADDHSLILQGLQELVVQHFSGAKITVVSSKDELFSHLKEHSPQVILLDLFMGKDKAHDFFDDLKKTTKKSKIIIISSNEDTATINHFIKRGADGFVGKSENAKFIVKAIESVLNEQSFLSENLRNRIKENDDTAISPQNIRLTRREKEVLSELLKEKSNREIATALFITEKTVEHHKANLYVKFDVKNVSGLVKKALINGFY